MQHYFVDSGYLEGLADPNDPRHSTALEWYELVRAVKVPLITTDLCLIEFIDAFSDVGRRRAGREIVEEMQAYSLFAIVAVGWQLVEAGLELHSNRDDKSWSLTDCISMVVMRERNIRKVLTFDSDFVQAGFHALPLE